MDEFQGICVEVTEADEDKNARIVIYRANDNPDIKRLELTKNETLVSFCGDKPKEITRDGQEKAQEQKAAPAGEPVKDFFQGSLEDFEELDDSDLPF